MKSITRKTRETDISVQVKPGSGVAAVNTGARFLDHMMTTLARYSGLDITISATGDLKHHLIEDVAIALGLAVSRAIPETCARYGNRTVAMDDALVQAVIDAGGRPFYEGPLPSDLYEHWMRSFADNSKMTIHILVLRGKNRHHVVEASFKALGLAIRDAWVSTDTVFSTKGAVSTETT
jgi:imidazoleglycerol-phosphate dehydratase